MGLWLLRGRFIDTSKGVNLTSSEALALAKMKENAERANVLQARRMELEKVSQAEKE